MDHSDKMLSSGKNIATIIRAAVLRAATVSIGFAALAGSSSSARAAMDSLVTPADISVTRKMAETFDKLTPFSFKYDGKPSSELLSQWKPMVDEQVIDENRLRKTFTWNDPTTGLTARLVSVRYKDFPAIEWTAYLKNDGAADSKKIDDLRGIDASLTAGQAAAGNVVLHSEKGSDALDTDYQTIPIPLAADQSVSLASAGGRGSDGAAIPYFNYESPGAGDIPASGVCVAIGWPGQWDATFARSGQTVMLSAGQQMVHTVLHPGEEIRTPLIALVSYAGSDAQCGQNIWRRWMIAHNIPRVDGKMVGPMLCANSSHQFGEMIHANEQNQKQYVDAYFNRGIKLDYWWMDAGWYENMGRWENTGTWKVDAKRFPDGLKAVSDFIHTKGGKTIVWFEPERVTPGTELYDEHPDFLLSRPTNGLQLLTLGNGKGEPNAGYNDSAKELVSGDITWTSHQVSLHPGEAGETSVARFIFPAAGKYKIEATFKAADHRATTDVHVVNRGKALLNGQISPGSASQSYSGQLEAKRGDTIDFAVGYGANNNYACDTTAVDVKIVGDDGKTYSIAQDFWGKPDPKGAWEFGAVPHGDITHPGHFTPYVKGKLSPVDAGTWKLLNLGNPDARKWITDRVDSVIKAQAIGIYRQDFNIEPLEFWRAADSADRQGMTENLYVQGYLKYWDSLLERNPSIFMDSCASGGRRNDLETMRRSCPFLRSDRLFIPIGQQSQSFGFYQWIPLQGSPTLVGKSEIFKEDVGNKINPYIFRSDMAPIFNLCTDILNDQLDFDTYRKLLGQWRDIGPSYLGDYYPLTEGSLDPAQWMAWQFYLPQKGEGFVQAFRREEAGNASIKLKLKGLDRAATYDVVDVDRPDQKRAIGGAVLSDDGLDIAIDAKPGAALFRLFKLAGK